MSDEDEESVPEIITPKTWTVDSSEFLNDVDGFVSDLPTSPCRLPTAWLQPAVAFGLPHCAHTHAVCCPPRPRSSTSARRRRRTTRRRASSSLSASWRKPLLAMYRRETPSRLPQASTGSTRR